MRSICVVVLLFYSVRIFGQSIITQKITTDDGLPSSEVYSIIQDREGFIWMGTDNGAARYDGKKFKLFTSQEGLADNAILDIFEDIEGRLWFSSMGDEIAYYYKGKIQKFPFEMSEVLKDIRPRSPYIRGTDTLGQKWMSSVYFNTILKENKPGVFGQVYHTEAYSKTEIHLNYLIHGLGKQPHTNSNVVSQLVLVDTLHQKFSITKGNDYLWIKGPFLKGHKVTQDLLSFYRMRNGEYFGLSANGFYIHLNDNEVLKTGNLGFNQIMHFYEDANGNYWFPTQKGVYFYAQGKLQYEPEIFLKEYAITDVLLDKEGNFWFTDHNAGLHKAANINFRQLNQQGYAANTRTVSLAVRNGKLWFSTIGGDIYSMNEALIPKLVYSDERQSFDFFPFEVLENDNLWLPGGRRLVNGKIYQNTDEVGKSYSNDKFISAENGEIFVGATHGILRFQQNGKNVYSSDKKIDGNNAFSIRTNALIKDDMGLWIGCLKGLYFLKDNQYQSLGESIPILRNRIMAMESFGENLLLGTKGQGLIIFNKQTKEYQQISVKQGLVSNMVKTIYYSDIHREIYVGTNKGLSIIRFNSRGFQYRPINFDIYNGLPSNEINDIEYFEDKIWLATNRGIVFFDPYKLTSNKHRPPIYLEKMLVDDSITDFSSSFVQLSKHKRRIVFEYNGVGFRSGARIEYKYFLTDFDLDTTYTRNMTANYLNITPGNHTFYVWAKNEDGIWSDKPATITFNIPKKFTETYWFLALNILGTIGLVTVVFVALYQRKRKKLNLEIQTAELKQQALAALMNPHFIYNALAAIQHFINTDNIEKSNQYLSRFARLVRQNLNSVRNGFILLEDEIDRLKLYLEIEKMRFGEKLEYAVEIDDEVDITGLEIPSMILQPFVENAIWHGILPMNRNGKITVKFQMPVDDVLEVFIEDNGPGLDFSPNDNKKEHHTSMSMDITRERLQLLGQKTGKRYTVEIKAPLNGVGMVVYVRIPVIPVST